MSSSYHVFDRSEDYTLTIAKPHPTVSDLKKEAESIFGVTFDYLTHRGRLLDDFEFIDELDKQSKINARILIHLKDEKLLRSLVSMDASDSWTVANIKNLYTQREKRPFPPGSYLALKEEKNRLDDEKKLYDQGVKNEDELVIVSAPFTVTMIDGKNTIEVPDVYDWFTTRRLKESFNFISSTEGLSTSDRLICNNEEMFENTELYKYIQDYTKTITVYITREDYTAERFEYICADCGSDVTLKRNDAVRCRECGHRIVYKKRTKNPCQYLAR